MEKYNYITPEMARSTHAKTIKYSGGGTLEEFDKNLSQNGTHILQKAFFKHTLGGR